MMSIPLAAKSVATNALVLPCLNSASTLSLAPCDLSPWRDWVWIPSLHISLARSSAIFLVRVKIKTCCQFFEPIRKDVSSRLRSLSTVYTRCST